MGAIPAAGPSEAERIVDAWVHGLDRRLRFAIHTEHDAYISAEIAEDGVWEAFETELVMRTLRPGTTFVDCGANIGWYSVVAAMSGADVVAFEPEPRNLELLRLNLELNSVTAAVKVRPAAVGSQPGTVTLSLSRDNQGDHHVASDPDGQTVSVDLVRLDDEMNGRSIGFLKIDTQGSEAEILLGSSQLRQAGAFDQATMIVEFWPAGLARSGSNVDSFLTEIAAFLESSHRCFEIETAQSMLRPLTLDDLQRLADSGPYSAATGGHMNLLIVPTACVDTIADLVLSNTVSDQLSMLKSAERSVHSQNGEDGVLEHLAELTGCPETIVEFGAADGVECNSRYFVAKGWQYAAYDGDPRGCDWVREAFVDAGNINELLDETGLAHHIGILSIDLDGNDFWLFHRLRDSFMPVVLVVEYNAMLGPVDPLTVSYRSGRLRDHTNYYGASLSAFALEASRRGFDLVYGESSGVHAFFVRRDFTERAGLVPVPVSDAYVAPTVGLTDELGNEVGHRPTNRRFVRVESEAETRASFAAASSPSLTRPLRRAALWCRTRKSSRYWRTRLENRTRRIRGGGQKF